MAETRVCSIEGCGKPIFCRDQCSKHYDRWRRARPPKTCSVESCQKPAKTGNKLCHAHARKKWKYGDPLAGRTNGAPKRLYLKALTYEGEDCLIWPFGKNADGYAIYRPKHDDRTQILSRRICEDIHGEAPTPEHQAAHSCGNGHKGCINKTHVRWATPKENCQEKIVHGTTNRGQKCHSNKLSPDDVRRIRKLLLTTPATAIAHSYGVGKSTIYGIKHGKNWAWLE